MKKKSVMVARYSRPMRLWSLVRMTNFTNDVGAPPQPIGLTSGYGLSATNMLLVRPAQRSH